MELIAKRNGYKYLVTIHDTTVDVQPYESRQNSLMYARVLADVLQFRLRLHVNTRKATNTMVIILQFLTDNGYFITNADEFEEDYGVRSTFKNDANGIENGSMQDPNNRRRRR